MTQDIETARGALLDAKLTLKPGSPTFHQQLDNFFRAKRRTLEYSLTHARRAGDRNRIADDLDIVRAAIQGPTVVLARAMYFTRIEESMANQLNKHPRNAKLRLDHELVASILQTLSDSLTNP